MTLYKKIFKRFEGKITDYDLQELLDENKLEVEILLLDSAISDFNECKQDLSNRDDTTVTFNIVLTDLEIEILSLYMVKQWTSQFKNNQDLLENTLSPNSFTRFSPANKIKAVINLYDYSIIEAEIKVSKYIFTSDFIGGLS
jgi:hypothetical protein